MHLPYLTFEENRDHEEWQKNGIHLRYRPSGLVMHVSFPLDRADGETFAVVYRSPAGVLYRDWRSPAEITVTEVSEVQWKRLHDLIVTVPEGRGLRH